MLFRSSTNIEFLQYVTRRGLCEADDILNNAIGVVIGYGVYLVLKKHYSLRLMHDSSIEKRK